jgi:hypothetical protein
VRAITRVFTGVNLPKPLTSTHHPDSRLKARLKESVDVLDFVGLATKTFFCGAIAGGAYLP